MNTIDRLQRFGAFWCFVVLLFVTACVPMHATASRVPVLVHKPTVSSVKVLAISANTVALIGKVKLMASGIISDNGGGVISDHGSGIVSNNGSSVISNQSGVLISERGSSILAAQGAGLITRARFALADVDVAREVLLADARVRVLDAGGKAVTDAAGHPIEAMTDATGSYTLPLISSTANLVLRVTLGNVGVLHGGELAALLPMSSASSVEQSIDTATSLGADYVLANYVHGDQAIFDKLPGAQISRLSAALAAPTASLASAPSYVPGDMVGWVEATRRQVRELNTTLADIQALLLGQAHGGDGRYAATVALADPHSLAFDSQGRLLIGERLFGRIRAIDPAGTVSTFADVIRGEVKQNFPGFQAMVTAPDGGVYVATTFRVYHIDAQHHVTSVAGGDGGAPGPVDVDATTTTLQPYSLALAPDGTLYIGEDRVDRSPTTPHRLLALTPAGKLQQVDFNRSGKPGGRVLAMTVGADGVLYFVDEAVPAQDGGLYRYTPGGGVVAIAPNLAFVGPKGGIACAADGTLYVSQSGLVAAFAPDGTRRVVAGAGGPAATSALRLPDSMVFEPDGTLLIADDASGIVYALGTDGSLDQRAGTRSAVQPGAGLGDLALAAPNAAAFDEAGRLIIAPRGGHELEQFDGGNVSALLGGDAQPLSNEVSDPTGVAYFAGALYVLDSGNRRLVKVAKDGSVTTLVGGGPSPSVHSLQPGQRVPADQFLAVGDGLAMGPDGQPYWASVTERQVYRLAADGQVEVVAGKPFGHQDGLSTSPTLTDVLSAAETNGGPAAAALLVQPTGLAFDASGTLYIADGGALQIRKVVAPGSPTATIEAAYGAAAADTFLRLAANPQAADPEGDARTATYWVPTGLAFDAAQNLYVAELGTVSLPLLYSQSAADSPALGVGTVTRYARVRKITPAGTVTTLAGPGGKFFADPAAADGLLMPLGIAVAADGRLAICDTGANHVAVLPAGSY